jgi:hypothetical protein
MTRYASYVLAMYVIQHFRVVNHIFLLVRVAFYDALEHKRYRL